MRNGVNVRDHLAQKAAGSRKKNRRGGQPLDVGGVHGSVGSGGSQLPAEVLEDNDMKNLMERFFKTAMSRAPSAAHIWASEPAGAAAVKAARTSSSIGNFQSTCANLFRELPEETRQEYHEKARLMKANPAGVNAAQDRMK